MKTPAERYAAKKPPRPTSPDLRRKVIWKCSLAECRAALGLTLRDVEKGTGVSNCTLSHIERGYGLTLETAWAIAEFFGVPITELWQRLPGKGKT
jgi:DNA-binding XRE family transcriptional regulator